MDKTEIQVKKKDMSWKSFFILLIAIFVFRIFILEPHTVSGSSMDETFKNHDYLLVDKLSYRFIEPKRNEVIVFLPPEAAQNKNRFIKRIIALPGDTVEIRDGITYINDKATTESFVVHTSDKEVARFTLAENEYFAMGDNRAGSFDSRFFGPIQKDGIEGRAFLRLYPFNKISIFPGIDK